jgi:isoleucyl-tRNA synthetase
VAAPGAGVELEASDVEVDLSARAGFAAASGSVGVVVLDTRVDDRLRRQGLLWELVSRLQNLRKELSLDFTERVRLWIGGSVVVVGVAKEHGDVVAREVLAVEVRFDDPVPSAAVRSVDIEGETVTIAMLRAS